MKYFCITQSGRFLYYKGSRLSVGEPSISEWHGTYWKDRYVYNVTPLLEVMG